LTESRALESWHPRSPAWQSLLYVAVVGLLFGGFAVILAVPFTSAVATLIDVLVLGHEPPTEEPRRTLRLRRSG